MSSSSEFEKNPSFPESLLSNFKFSGCFSFLRVSNSFFNDAISFFSEESSVTIWLKIAVICVDGFSVSSSPSSKIGAVIESATSATFSSSFSRKDAASSSNVSGISVSSTSFSVKSAASALGSSIISLSGVISTGSAKGLVSEAVFSETSSLGSSIIPLSGVISTGSAKVSLSEAVFSETFSLGSSIIPLSKVFSAGSFELPPASEMLTVPPVVSSVILSRIESRSKSSSSAIASDVSGS